MLFGVRQCDGRLPGLRSMHQVRGPSSGSARSAVTLDSHGGEEPRGFARMVRLQSALLKAPELVLMVVRRVPRLAHEWPPRAAQLRRRAPPPELSRKAPYSHPSLKSLTLHGG